MEQHIEIEFKNLVTQAEFEKLKNYFHIEDSSFKSQTNFYFDTKSFTLKEQRCALRIREKNGQFELTLKQPAHEGLLETNQTLSKKQAEAFIRDGQFPHGDIENIIQTLAINPSTFTCFGELKTKRAELQYRSGLIVLDHSTYVNKQDYEIEYEVENAKIGQKTFKELLELLQIPLRPTENKVKRFYEAAFK